MLRIYFSNHLDHLFSFLRDNLLENQGPFEKKEIVIPHAPLKSWIRARLAEDPIFGIAAGVDFYFPHECFELKTRSSFFKKIPSDTELSFAISHYFFKRIKEDPKDLDQELLKFFNLKNQKCLSLKEEKKLILFSNELASLYNHYSRHEKNANVFFENLKENSWQKKLWSYLFGKQGLFSTVTQGLENFQFANEKNPKGGSLHLFAPAFFSESELAFFSKLSESTSVSLYVFSLTRSFIGDVLSRKEAAYLSRALNTMPGKESFLEHSSLFFDSNQLLANWGRSGKYFFNALDSMESKTDWFEKYEIHSETKNYSSYQNLLDSEISFKEGKFGILQALQSDIILGRISEKAPPLEIHETYENSLRIHRSVSKSREVEALYNDLVFLFENQIESSKKIEPQEVLVVASNIALYEPYFHRIFGSPESKLPYRVAEIQFPEKNPLIQEFLLLLRLGETRFEKKDLFKLLNSKALRSKFGFDEEAIQLISKWLKPYLSWGLSESHQKEFLQEEHQIEIETCLKQNSLEEAISHLLSDRLKIESSEKDNFLGVTGLSLLDRLIVFLRSLEHDLKAFRQIKKNLQSWQLELTYLLKDYFDIEIDDFKEDAAHLLKAFQLIGRMQTQEDLLFSFGAVALYLDKILQNVKISHRDSLQNTLTFSTPKSSRSIPYKIIAFLGLQDNCYPSLGSKTSLDLLRKSPLHTNYPSELDQDLQSFIELILASQEHLILSYTSTTKEKEPGENSALIRELLEYLDEAFLIKGQKPSNACFFKHPEKSEDESYFTSDSPLKNYRKSCFKSAQNKRCQTKLFMPLQISEDASDSKKWVKVLELKEISAFLRNPLKTFFRRKWDVSFYQSKEKKETLSLGFYQIQDLMMKSFTPSNNNSLEKQFSKENLLPGIVQKAAKYRVKREKDNLEQLFSLYDKKLDLLHTVDFLPGIPTLKQVGENKWVAPAFKFTFEGQGSIELLGSLKSISKAGIICFSKQDMGSLIPHLPELLLYASLIETYDFPFEKAFFSISDKPAYVPFLEKKDSLNSLKSLIQHYIDSLQHPFPLLPEWIQPVAEKDCVKLNDILQGSFEEREINKGPFLERNFRSVASLDADHLIKAYEKPSALLKDLVEPFISRGKK
ncbi:exodeoxyribonuclease V subunit gamma [Criblamydia sequanensis]|uniref:Exodeoxyribonuclease V gamma subunit n=1 Tax=Candidatus Criblamydia sequanensis CRIB-18 TaxID=1437425 RepID=A0A090E0E4_9BACT|nr:exodeoxyribonuclease V subunit gamma [Criblamydia sequanensis]CDR34284.1 Exodeoxyribonuclease V gamma subunit [Criblamydia sequanensis CRIB-18]